MWSPDAYEGAPAVVTGFMSTGVKAAAVAAFARLFLSTLSPMVADWTPVLWAIAAATMVVGTVVGVSQTNLKRMLAYSSIAHGGYLLVAIIAANDVGKASLLFYLASYAVTNVGAFGIIALLGSRHQGNDELRDYAGLAHSHPGLAALMTIFLLSLGGFPPTAGFIAKWYTFTRRGQRRLLRAGDHRRAVERRVGLLLPAHRGDDVHVRARRPAGAAGGVARGHGRPGGLGRRGAVARRAAGAGDRLGGAIDRDDLLTARTAASG